MVERKGERPRIITTIKRRIVAETSFVSNTLKEAILHPRTTSTLDKQTGKVVGRGGKRLGNFDNKQEATQL